MTDTCSTPTAAHRFKRPTWIATQSRCPSGLLGHLIAAIMARETAPANQETLNRLGLAPGQQVLEIGFGHGRTVDQAAAGIGDGTVAGVDTSPTMVRHASRRNRAHIKNGRVQLHLTDGAALPFAADRFDRIFAVHTVYFWPDPIAQFAEIRRTLCPGGRFVLCFRPGEDPGFAAAFPAEIYHIRPASEIAGLMTQSGLRVIDRTVEYRGTGQIAWLTATKD